MKGRCITDTILQRAMFEALRYSCAAVQLALSASDNYPFACAKAMMTEGAPRQRRRPPLRVEKIRRTLKQVLTVIEEGGHTRGMTDRMRELEAREDRLKELLAQEPAEIPDIHPNVSGIYRKKIERLTEALTQPEDRNEDDPDPIVRNRIAAFEVFLRRQEAG